jgi:hypothetical protein
MAALSKVQMETGGRARELIRRVKISFMHCVVTASERSVHGGVSRNGFAV